MCLHQGLVVFEILTLHAPLQSEISEEAATRIGDISAPRDTKWQKSNFECGTTSGAGQDVH
jgi:hypothetical protein